MCRLKSTTSIATRVSHDVTPIVLFSLELLGEILAFALGDCAFTLVHAAFLAFCPRTPPLPPRVFQVSFTVSRTLLAIAYIFYLYRIPEFLNVTLLTPLPAVELCYKCLVCFWLSLGDNWHAVALYSGLPCLLLRTRLVQVAFFDPNGFVYIKCAFQTSLAYFIYFCIVVTAGSRAILCDWCAFLAVEYKNCSNNVSCELDELRVDIIL